MQLLAGILPAEAEGILVAVMERHHMAANILVVHSHLAILAIQSIKLDPGKSVFDRSFLIVPSFFYPWQFCLDSQDKSTHKSRVIQQIGIMHDEQKKVKGLKHG